MQVIPNVSFCKALFDPTADRAHIIETAAEVFRFRRTVARKKEKPKEG
jgi:hypothetical protein